ncbi:hypothetical protein EXE25_17545 [Acinetobacter bouvetii]|uniref:Uncharacterized protein n=1 Tax=Acinetobacter bouvetii TaxID=202951 RepID=A0A4Q7AM99_9GAMM|nr:hypothetical protein [Acinetobacter bouvetii]RZG64140.1 hypothetical protein EXE25_17545 [Acinetobacter bouvetii]
MKFKAEEKVVFVSKRRSSRIWVVEGDTNWRPNHILLSKDGKGPLEPVHENDVRAATQEEIDAGARK